MEIQLWSNYVYFSLVIGLTKLLQDINNRVCILSLKSITSSSCMRNYCSVQNRAGYNDVPVLRASTGWQLIPSEPRLSLSRWFSRVIRRDKLRGTRGCLPLICIGLTAGFRLLGVALRGHPLIWKGDNENHNTLTTLFRENDSSSSPAWRLIIRSFSPLVILS